VDTLDFSDKLHPTFPAQGDILSIGGDALMWGIKFCTYQLVLVWNFKNNSFQRIIDMAFFKNLSYQPDLSSKIQG
jgi:hypothetical protein